jgi:hypothetical protein
MTTLDLDALVRDAGTTVKYKGANGYAFDTPREAAASLATEAMEKRWRDLPSINRFYQGPYCGQGQYRSSPISMGEVLSLVCEDPALFEDMIKLARFTTPVHNSKKWTGR